MQNTAPRTWDWPSAGLLIGIVLAASVRLAATGWTSHLYFGENMAVAGAALGLVIGQARLSKAAARLFMLNYMLMIVPWQLSALAPATLKLADKLISLGPRFTAAWSATIQQQQFEDPILFIFVVTLGLWLVGFAAGFALTRQRNLLSAVLPSGMILLVVQFYDPEVTARSWLLAIHLFLSLGLMGRLHYLENRRTWDERRVFQIRETARDLSNGLAFTAALVVLIAWITPVSVSSLNSAEEFWKAVTKPFRPVQNRIGDALDPLESPYGRSEETDFYSERMALGRGLPLSESTVFRVDIPEDLIEVPRIYWRGRVFDTYNGQVWINNATPRASFAPSPEDLSIPDLGGRQVFNFSVHNATRQSLIYAPSQPVWTDRAGDVLAQILPDGERDIIAFKSIPPVEAGESYIVHSALGNPSVEELRAAGVDYPGWVTARYLQLPPEFSPRISELATRITQRADTPYDMAAAITSWLRNEIEYEAVIPAPPVEQEPLEWVLFEYKRGFCMYYASAEVLMLRSLGVPARLAVGFAQGELIEDQQEEQSYIYLVQRKDYHAWPEVYFPNIGWVEFEPTASQDALTRPRRTASIAPTLEAASPTEAVVATPESELSEFERTQNDEGLTNLAVIPWYITYHATLNWILAILVVITLWLFNLRSKWVTKIPLYFEARAARTGTRPPRWIRNWAAWTRLSPIERAFEAVNFSLRAFGERMPVHASSGERSKRLIGILPAARPHVQNLTEHLEVALFGRGGSSDLRAARRAAAAILLHTFLARLIKWWQSVLNFIGL